MKTSITFGPRRLVGVRVLVVTLFLLTFAALGAQTIYYTQYLGTGSVFKYVVGGGTTTLASSLDFPSQLVVDSGGNLFVSNQGGGTITKITPGGITSTFASGLTYPNGLAIDGSGNLYVSSTSSGAIKKITPGGTVSPFADTGSAVYGLAYDTATSTLYAAQSSGTIIYSITSGGAHSTFTTFSTLNGGLAFYGGNLFVADSNNVYQVSPSTPSTHSVFFSGINASGLAFDSTGKLYAARQGAGIVTQIAADGLSSSNLLSGLTSPAGVAAIPEPAETATLAGVFAAGLACLMRRRQRGLKRDF